MELFGPLCSKCWLVVLVSQFFTVDRVHFIKVLIANPRLATISRVFAADGGSAILRKRVPSRVLWSFGIGWAASTDVLVATGATGSLKCKTDPQFYQLAGHSSLNPGFRAMVLHAGCDEYRCLNSTPTNTARTKLHSMITFHHANTRCSSSRIVHLCPQNNRHPRFMSRLLPNPTTDHQHKFSLTHFIHFSNLSDGLTFAHRPYDSRPLCTLRCSKAEWRINTNPISHRL